MTSYHKPRFYLRLVPFLMILVMLLAPIAGFASANAQSETPQIVSPEVVHTGTAPTGYEVTFRYYDPTATRVRIKGEWYFSDDANSSTTTSAGYLPSQWKPGDFPIAYPNATAANWPVADMTLDPSTGIWSYTTPLPSGVFTYAFYVNCTAPAPSLSGCTGLSDPANPPWNTPVVPPASVEPNSQVFVPSDPAFGTIDYSWQFPNKVHGTLVDVTYPTPLSTNPIGSHPLAVYTPPGYDPNRAVPYPTLYLSHGGGGNEVDWSTQGVAGNIIDNLIAAGKIQPMVVVMTNFYNLSPSGVATYAQDVTENVIPYVEANYNVSKNPADRAFAGLSAGGARGNELLFNYTTTFGYYSIQSPGSGGVPASDSPLWQNPELKNLLGLQVGGGIYDPIRYRLLDEITGLTTNGIPFVDDSFAGGHEWYVWRIMLRDFAETMAFKHTTTSLSQVAAPGSSGQRNVDFVVASVKASSTEPARLTGTVQFYLDGQSLDPARPVLPDGTAKQALPQLSPGQHTVTAVYSGDNFYNTSTSETLIVTR